MSTVGKLAVRRVHTGDFAGEQAQRLAQQAAQKANSMADVLNAMLNRSYVSLATDATATASYVTLLTASLTTVLASGYLLIHFTASSVHTTNAATNYFQVLVDGVVKKGAYSTFPAATYAGCASMLVRVPVTRGLHTVLLQWKSDNVTGRINASSVNEEHANMLVQEVA